LPRLRAIAVCIIPYLHRQVAERNDYRNRANKLPIVAQQLGKCPMIHNFLLLRMEEGYMIHLSVRNGSVFAISLRIPAMTDLVPIPAA